MRKIFSLVGGVAAGVVAFAFVLILAVALVTRPEKLPDGPGLTMAFLMIFSVFPLFVTTAIALCVSLAVRVRPKLAGSAIGGVLAAIALGGFNLHLGYIALLGFPAVIAGLVAGSISGWLSVALAGAPRRPGRRP